MNVRLATIEIPSPSLDLDYCNMSEGLMRARRMCPLGNEGERVAHAIARHIPGVSGNRSNHLHAVVSDNPAVDTAT